MGTKQYTVYRMKDPRGPDGYMYHADGRVIREAIAAGKITENDTWDPERENLIAKLRAKGVEV
jgi:YD repeat-containing protein